jgi:methylamine--corrinoid protein Co-methyltransferase
MTLDEGNRIILALLEKYESVFEQPGGNPGKSIEEAYDMTLVQPRPEWLKLYEVVKKELEDLGIVF